MEPRKRRFGDRKDGYRLRNAQSFFAVMPHIMKTRNDALVEFEEVIEIDELEQYVRRIRREKDLPNFSMYHLIIAAAVRLFVLRPRLNRFVMAGKVYARNYLAVGMTVKREISQHATEVCIKPKFEKTATLYDVYHGMNETIDAEVRAADSENGTDSVAKILNVLPAWVVRLFVNFMDFLDHRGLATNFINKVSPFHTSFFITDVGSLGIGPVFHHIYNFGNTSAFIAMGKKEVTPVASRDGTVEVKKVIRLRLVLDERICDGQYYAESFRIFHRLLKKPELLELPPEEIPEDTWI